MLHLPLHTRRPVFLTSLLVALALPLCAQQTAPDALPPNERIETFSHGPVPIELIASPALDPITTDYIWMTRPYASRTDSCIISDSVGCGNTVCMRSSSVVSSPMAMTKP